MLTDATLRLGLAATSPRVARAFVGQTLADWDRDDLSDLVVLLANELVTNAMLHARSPVGLRVERRPGLVRVEVCDDDPRQPSARAFTTTAQTGRGLALVQALARSWGAERVPDDGKVVWFEVPA